MFLALFNAVKVESVPLNPEKFPAGGYCCAVSGSSVAIVSSSMGAATGGLK